jgi:hypothetical protein
VGGWVGGWMDGEKKHTNKIKRTIVSLYCTVKIHCIQYALIISIFPLFGALVVLSKAGNMTGSVWANLVDTLVSHQKSRWCMNLAGK